VKKEWREVTSGPSSVCKGPEVDGCWHIERTVRKPRSEQKRGKYPQLHHAEGQCLPPVTGPAVTDGTLALVELEFRPRQPQSMGWLLASSNINNLELHSLGEKLPAGEQQAWPTPSCVLGAKGDTGWGTRQRSGLMFHHGHRVSR
jgi:hypothetical protein